MSGCLGVRILMSILITFIITFYISLFCIGLYFLYFNYCILSYFIFRIVFHYFCYTFFCVSLFFITFFSIVSCVFLPFVLHFYFSLSAYTTDNLASPAPRYAVHNPATEFTVRKVHRRSFIILFNSKTYLFLSKTICILSLVQVSL